MNILVDSLPNAVEIDGDVYEINTDFRTVIKVILAFDDVELASIEKQNIMLSLLYKDKIPQHNMMKAAELILRFITGPAADDTDTDVADTEQFYSFTKDASLIYAAFQQTHGIDLQTAQLHWWQFVALFSDLGADTMLCNLISLRKRVAYGEATKEDMKIVRRLGSSFDVDKPVQKSIEDLEAERRFFDLVQKHKESKDAS